MLVLALALCLSILLLPSLLLRYMPFKLFLTRQQNKRLALCYGVWFVLLFLLQVYRLQTEGVTIQIYKQNVMFGWLPYLAINIVCIPHHLEHHIFVAGMQCIYVMLIHEAAILAVINLLPGADLVKYYFLQTGFFITLFALTYPLIKNFFNKVFLSAHAINDRTYWRSVCLLPFLIVADLFFLSYGDRIMAIPLFVPRLILLPLFFMLMYAFSHDVRRMEDGAQLDANNDFLRMQLNTIQENTRLTEEANQKMAVIRHDIRHYNQLLSTLLKEKKNEAALQLITQCDEHIQQTKIQHFCQNPIINAALSLYINKAKQEQVPVEYKIDLPPVLEVDENELAIVLSNLLENAFQASNKQPAGQRSIKIVTRTKDVQLVLSVANRFDGEVRLGEDMLPVTSRNGHGLGMRSLALFRDKYKATVLCSHQDGWFKTLLYVPLEKG